MMMVKKKMLMMMKNETSKPFLAAFQFFLLDGSCQYYRSIFALSSYILADNFTYAAYPCSKQLLPFLIYTFFFSPLLFKYWSTVELLFMF